MKSWLLSILVAAVAFSARADEEVAKKKSVAVLEYRSGSVSVAGIGGRLATQLKKTSSLAVVDPAEAKRRFARVEAEVARCAGNPTCVAQLGARLDVDEILLMGVSQLGDVVLTLQRIDVEDAKVGPHLAETLPEDQEIDDVKLLAWLQQLYPPEVFKRFGFIAITADRDGASVTVNGQPRGETPIDKLKVPAPKNYRLTIEKDGFVPFAAKIDVLPDATVEVRAELPPVGEDTAWYKRWYLWAIVGGVVAAGAIGVAVYATRPDDQHVIPSLVFP